MKKGKIEKTKKGTLILRDVNKPSSTFPLKGFVINEDMIGKECEYETRGIEVVKLLIEGKEVEKRKSSGEGPVSHKGNKVKYKILIPEDTRKVIKHIKDNPENFALRFTKYARLIHTSKGEKFEFFYREKREELFSIDTNFGSLNFKRIAEIMQRIKRSFELRKWNVLELKFSPAWRMVVGLGGASVYETSMTLHHIYGIPFIPGSAIKGVLRSHIIEKYFDKKEKIAEENDDFSFIFGRGGDEGEKGKVIFLDAFPVEEPVIKIDIMNPHYPEYYRGEDFPTDFQSPTPIPFLVVEKTSFRFFVAVKGGNRVFGMEINDFLGSELKEALKEKGIGAKTSLGYGIME